MGSKSALGRSALSLLSLALLATIAGACHLVPIGAAAADSSALVTTNARPLPKIPLDRPLTVLVRGWLWDGASQGRAKVPVRLFQPRVNQILDEKIGVTSDFYDYGWSRLPKDVFPESVRFVRWANSVTKKAAADGRCINFVGHSAGAAFVYRAASQRVHMGYLGTLGLPTFGRERPPDVQHWTNFFTSSHPDDIAGRMWGRQIAADENVDLKQEHRNFWFDKTAASSSAEGIAQAWTDCRA